MNEIIKVQNLSFKYSKAGPVILDSINLEIERGSITAIAGLSGCGKSTLALCLCGAIPKSLPGILSGKILLDEKNIEEVSLPRLAEMVGIVFQEVDNQLFLPTVEAEVAFALENLCRTYNEIEETVERVLKTLGIEHLRYKNPSQLSGGEKHLAAIASVLSLDPEIIILDEVFSELDGENKQLIVNTVRKLKSMGKTFIIIDHSIKNLLLADTILLMKAGRIEERIEVDRNNELLYDKLTEFFLQQIG